MGVQRVPFPSLPDALLPFVPRAVRLGALLAIPFSAIVGELVGLLLFVLSRRDLAPPDAHWTERARRSLGARKAFRFIVLYVGIVATLFVWLEAFIFGPEIRVIVALGAGLAASSIADRHRRRFMSALHDRTISMGAWTSFTARWLFLGAPMFVLLGWGAATMPTHFDRAALVHLAIVAAGLLAAHAGALWLLAGGLGILRPASPELRAIVDAVAEQTGIHPRDVLVFPTGGVPLSNAYAIPPARMLVFTEELLTSLEPEEIAAITAHELGHVAEGPLVIAARVLKGLVLLPIVLIAPAYHALGPLGPALAFVAFFVLARGFAAWSRRLEARADRVAHGEHGEDGAVYGRALERIYTTNLVPAVLATAGTHPNLWDRLQAAGVTPAYSKPALPNFRSSNPRVIAIAAVVVALYAIVGTWARGEAEKRVDAALEKLEELETFDAE